MSDDNLAIEYDKIFEDDKLGIKSSVIDFAHLIEQNTYIEGGVSKVYSISADFGTGKTFFCEKLKSVLEKDGVQTTKMNIWEMDFYEDPLMPILAKLNEIYEKEDEVTLEKMLKMDIMQKYEDDQDLLEDVIIENKQAVCSKYE